VSWTFLGGSKSNTLVSSLIMFSAGTLILESAESFVVDEFLLEFLNFVKKFELV